MKLFLILIKLDETYTGPDSLEPKVLQRFLEARVQGAINFRGMVRESKIIEGGERCRISEQPLTGPGSLHRSRRF